MPFVDLLQTSNPATQMVFCFVAKLVVFQVLHKGESEDAKQFSTRIVILNSLIWNSRINVSTRWMGRSFLFGHQQSWGRIDVACGCGLNAAEKDTMIDEDVAGVYWRMLAICSHCGLFVVGVNHY